MYYVYILQSEKDGKRYIGCTSNLANRLAAHNAGLVTATRHRIPFRAVYYEKVGTLGQARRRELTLKLLKGGDVVKKLITDF